ncbi:MAG: hypothetical protein C0404_03290 [Verrucomicrobia bacterium]|nr:hypothetical protein [Verrucomicrobiota bacterium]
MKENDVGGDQRATSTDGTAGWLEEYCSGNTLLSLDVVSAVSGDRALSETETASIESLKRARGEGFFTDLLYAVTHQYFAPEIASRLWSEILAHKYSMSQTLRRNVRIAVAALDYLGNLKNELRAATVIDEAHMADFVRLSLHDGLTRLFNHTSCHQRIGLEVKRHARFGTAVSVIMLDIDDFKRINDQYGHIAGDNVLFALGAILKSATREVDMCCRYGGEEFAVILPSTDAGEAAKLAERLRARVEESRPGGVNVTVSMGVAACDDNVSTSQALLAKADAALYQAKRSGKNKVVVST